jgi:hypothetical protein
VKPAHMPPHLSIPRVTSSRSESVSSRASNKSRLPFVLLRAAALAETSCFLISLRLSLRPAVSLSKRRTAAAVSCCFDESRRIFQLCSHIFCGNPPKHPARTAYLCACRPGAALNPAA